MRVLMRLSQLYVSFVAVVALSACASTNPVSRGAPTPNPHAKVGNPYQIAGRTYVPSEVPVGYTETGVASWYGPNFHGKLTANGEVFDMNRLSAAHRTFPMPSLVRVTNLENGRSAVLRLNDRGPFADDRVIDLSREAAERLGTREQGLADVRVEYLGPARLDDAIVRVGERENYAALRAPGRLRADAGPSVAPQPPAPNAAPSRQVVAIAGTAAPQAIRASATRQDIPSGPTAVERQPAAPVPADTPAQAVYYVQLAVFSSPSAASNALAGLPASIPVESRVVLRDGGEFTHLRLGPYAHEFAAREAERVARGAGFDDAHLVMPSGRR